MTNHVMIVDDNDAVRGAFAKVLKMSGFEVTTAADGRDALSSLRASDRLDLILLDLKMPGLDGRAFRKRQRELELSPEVPVVVISSLVGSLEPAAEGLGAEEALAKPIDPSDLVDVVEEHCLAER